MLVPFSSHFSRDPKTLKVGSTLCVLKMRIACLVISEATYGVGMK